MHVVAVALKNIFERRETIRHGYKIKSEAPIMRHFSVELEHLG
jgi:tryptophanase